MNYLLFCTCYLSNQCHLILSQSTSLELSGFSKLFEIDFESSLKFRTRFHRLCPRPGAGGDVAVALIIYEPCSSHNHGTSLKLIIQININKNINIHNYGANLILIININKTSMYTCSSHNHGTSLNLIINIDIKNTIGDGGSTAL